MKRFVIPAGSYELRKCLDSATAQNKLLVTVEEYSATRDLDMNAAYFAGTITPAAEQLGYESSDDLHYVVCGELYGWKEVKAGKGTILVPVRTTTKPRTMSRKEFRQHMERAAALLTSMGVRLPARELYG